MSIAPRLVAGAMTLLVSVALGYLLTVTSVQHEDIVIRDPIPVLRKPPAPPHKDWRLLDMAGHFRFYAPPGTSYDPQRGTDSYVGRFTGPGFSLDFDFGLYSNDLRGFKDMSRHREELFSVDGHPAVFHTAPLASGAIAIGIYVPNVHCGRLIIGIRCDWDALEIDGKADDLETAGQVRTMFRTLQFPKNLYE